MYVGLFMYDYVCMFACMYLYVCMHVCMHVCINICIYVWLYVWLYLWLYCVIMYIWYHLRVCPAINALHGCGSLSKSKQITSGGNQALPSSICHCCVKCGETSQFVAPRLRYVAIPNQSEWLRQNAVDGWLAQLWTHGRKNVVFSMIYHVNIWLVVSTHQTNYICYWGSSSHFWLRKKWNIPTNQTFSGSDPLLACHGLRASDAAVAATFFSEAPAFHALWNGNFGLKIDHFAYDHIISLKNPGLLQKIGLLLKVAILSKKSQKFRGGENKDKKQNNPAIQKNSKW